MDRSKYSLVAGVALLITGVFFFMLPAIFDNMDAFVPFMFAIALIGAAVVFFAAGYSSRS